MIDIRGATGIVGAILAFFVFVACIFGLFSVGKANEHQHPSMCMYFLDDEQHFVSAKFVSMNEVDWSRIVGENGEVVALVSDDSGVRAIWVERSGDYWKITREKTKEPLTNEE